MTFKSGGVTDAGAGTGTTATIGNIGTTWANGNLLVVIYNNGGSATGATASIASGAMATNDANLTGVGLYNFRTYYKTLVAGTDNNTAITVTNATAAAPVIWAIYSGISQCTLKTGSAAASAAGASSITLGSYTPAGNTAGGLLFLTNDRFQTTPTTATGFTPRVTNTPCPTGGYHVSSIFDASAYGGAGATYSGFGASALNTITGFYVELLV